jgi:hypothetical protein
MLFPGGVIAPSELRQLRRIHRTICSDTQLPPESVPAERIASHLMKLFMNGMTDETELLRIMRNRHAVPS